MRAILMILAMIAGLFGFYIYIALTQGRTG